MLAEKQFTDWFRTNGIDIDMPFPLHLMPRLFRKALACDSVLFAFIGSNQCFTDSPRKNYIMLRCKSWQDAFQLYSLYGIAFNRLEA